MEYKFIVWVGGLDDYFTNEKEAVAHAENWRDMGYDDIIIEGVGA